MTKVKEVMRKFFVHVSPNDTVRYAAELMKEKGVSSVLVKDKGEYLGIVTERDILYKVVAEGKDPSKIKVSEIMSSPLITIDKDSDLEEAIRIFKEKNIRRLPVRDGKEIVGIITLKSLIGDLRASEELSQSMEEIRGFICAFCGSVFPNEKDLSKHIDRVHIGAGILEERRIRS